MSASIRQDLLSRTLGFGLTLPNGHETASHHGVFRCARLNGELAGRGFRKASERADQIERLTVRVLQRQVRPPDANHEVSAAPSGVRYVLALAVTAVGNHHLTRAQLKTRSRVSPP